MLAAGIGSGYASKGVSSVGSLRIIDSIVNSTGDEAAGIGSGHASGGNSSIVNLTIEGSSVIAEGATGIGSGYANGGGFATVDLLRILNSSVRARSRDERGAGIGSGHSHPQDGKNGECFVLNLEIENSEIDAAGARYCPGIGSGRVQGGLTWVGNLSIKSSSVKAVSDLEAAAIGIGYELSNGKSSINMLSITDSVIDIADSSTSIGIGGSNVKTLIMSGDICLICSSWVEKCITAGSTIVRNSSIQAQVPHVLFSTNPTQEEMNDYVLL
jgi:hypothetical protein